MFVMLDMLILGSSLVATLAILARVIGRVRDHDHIFIVLVHDGDHSSERTIVFVRLIGWGIGWAVKRTFHFPMSPLSTSAALTLQDPLGQRLAKAWLTLTFSLVLTLMVGGISLRITPKTPVLATIG